MVNPREKLESWKERNYTYFCKTFYFFTRVVTSLVTCDIIVDVWYHAISYDIISKLWYHSHNYDITVWYHSLWYHSWCCDITCYLWYHVLYCGIMIKTMISYIMWYHSWCMISCHLLWHHIQTMISQTKLWYHTMISQAMIS